MNKVIHAIQDDYPAEFAHCFGCGRLNEKGHHFRTGWFGDKTLTLYEPKDEYMAVPGFAYGGFLASMIDCHGTGSAALALHRKNGYEPGSGHIPPRFVTASLQVDFVKPTPLQSILQAVGTVEEIHPKKWRTTIEVFAGDTLCAKGDVTAVVMPDSFIQR
ncbi:PaaI family thioesterase [Siminovitchia sediminis]|uniref:PaaI family thioesterase n=1 Tax=Siminovitchia sediminis TaxID=1274353 RepID=A0ABW4KBZ2_9BACI